MTRMGNCIFFLMVLFASSCGPADLADLRLEGEAQTKKLAGELRSVETKEDLQKLVPKLRKRFNQIAEILIAARSFPKEDQEPS